MFQEEIVRQPKAFFIARFDDEFEFIFERFQWIFEDRDDIRIQGQKLKLEKLDLTSEYDLRKALSSMITEASLILVDVSPTVNDNHLIWNPNVMYELGRAEQIHVPMFVMCRQQFRPSNLTSPLPFDILASNIHWFAFTTKGLDEICASFMQWFRMTKIVQYYSTLGFINIARTIRQEILEWPPESHTHFRTLLLEFVKQIEGNVKSMTHHIIEHAPYQLRPPSPANTVDALLVETISVMNPGDSYDTVSVLPFWMSLGTSNKFLDACIDASDRGVPVQRLILIPDRTLRSDEETILREHERAAKDHPNYVVKFRALPEHLLNNHYAHCGICHWEVGKSKPQLTAFKPVYELRDEKPMLIGIDYEYERESSAYLRRFEEEWENPLAKERLDEVKKKKKGK